MNPTDNSLEGAFLDMLAGNRASQRAGEKAREIIREAGLNHLRVYNSGGGRNVHLVLGGPIEELESFKSFAFLQGITLTPVTSYMNHYKLS